MTPLLGAWLLWLAASGGGGEADGGAADSGVAETVEVVAGLPDPGEIAAFATTVDVGELAARGADAADVLRRVPGARVRDYGGLGSYATISLRASTSQQVTVLIDGVTQNRAQGGAFDLSSIPASQLESITVYRGFGPASYGASGIGGVVDVRTRAPGPDPEVRVDLLAGELGTTRTSSSIALPTGSRGSLRIGAERLTGDGDYRYLDSGATFFDPGDDVVLRRRNNDVEQESVLLRHVWTGGERQFRSQVRLLDRERGHGGIDGHPAASARGGEELLEAGATWSRRSRGPLRGVDVEGGAFRQRLDFRDPRGEVGLNVQDQTTRIAGASVAARARLRLGRHGLLGRAELRREEARVRDRVFDSPDRGGARRDTLRLGLEDVVDLARWSLAPSIGWERRRDDFRGAGAGTVPPPSGDVRDDGVSAKLGVAFRPRPRTSLRASVGRFYRSPGLAELFGDRGAVVGNPGLEAERGVAAELGLRHDPSPGVQRPDFEVVLFARNTDDLIRLVPVGPGTAKPLNLDETTVRGVELALGWDVPGGWRLDAGATLQRARDETSGEPLVYQPDYLGFAGARWRRGGLTALWETTYTGENTTTTFDVPELRMPERWIHDATLSYRWPSGFEMGVDVHNVLDRRTRDLLRYPLPGRVALVHLGWHDGARR